MKLQTFRKLKKIFSSFFIVVMFTTVIPFQAMAITSGPAQEEFSTFTPAQTSEMVNLFTGDFNYNIPLLSIPGPNGGYPGNLF